MKERHCKTELKNDIIDLEEKYMLYLIDMFRTPEFKNSIIQLTERISKDYDLLSEHWVIKNKVAIALERVTRFFIYKNSFSKDFYHSPISSDIAFYTEDALICIDTKTIDLSGNSGDEKTIQFNNNQVSIKNHPKIIKELNSNSEHKIHYKAALPTIDPYTKKPVLTYFLRLVYEDNYKSFCAKRMSLACIPNGELSEDLYGSNLIDNFKTYSYINTKHAERIEKEKGLKNLEPISKIDNNWIECEGRSYYDDSVYHPIYRNEHVIRRKINNKYGIVLGGATARVSPDKIKDRKNSKGENWTGYINFFDL